MRLETHKKPSLALLFKSHNCTKRTALSFKFDRHTNKQTPHNRHNPRTSGQNLVQDDNKNVRLMFLFSAKQNFFFIQIREMIGSCRYSICLREEVKHKTGNKIK